MGVVRRIALLALVLIFGILYIGGRAEQERRRAEATLKQARAALDSARAMRAGAGERGVLLDADDLQELREAGLTDPERQLREDLLAQSSGIPIHGVLGGTMGFHDTVGVILLPGHYVYAPADDGHIGAHMILRYEVRPPGKIRWTMVDAKTD